MTTYYGLPNLVQFLLDDGPDANSGLQLYGTPFMRQHIKVTQSYSSLLVERGAHSMRGWQTLMHFMQLWLMATTI
jgi:hypothetical protein